MNAGLEEAETEEVEVEEEIDVATNGYDCHVANCELLNAELERVHKKVDEYADGSVRKSQQTMLNKLQARVLELTALD